MATWSDSNGSVRLPRWLLPALFVLGLIAAIWFFALQQTGIQRQQEMVSTLIPVDQPPPPPPPKEPPPPPKEVVQQITPPTPQQAVQQPNPQATPQQNAVTENAEAQEGGDAFNIGAGSGNGMTGGGPQGFLETAGTYGEYVRGLIARAVRTNPTLHDKEFTAGIKLWFDANGAIARVELTKSTGTELYDSELGKLLNALSGVRPPSPTVLAQMPIRFTIDERRSL